ncbi:hypothetical protein SASPL_143440 [Salvia splendens]|uniref:Vinorine synthase n=1 Tax=Salvia splendens TaxID=180675 RepID=A0A8X8ZAV0_SALSN|nr:hypothetical protein SASPL_143440 [Salvia splendens]
MQSPEYIPFIFLYENNRSTSKQEISKRLRQSLSETLTIFYPIAGTVVQNSHVDCDDTGAEFVEARVHAPLSHFTQNPNFEELVKQLFPTADGTETRNLSVKISFFECGGFAVGLFLSHKLVDGSSAAAFVRAWGKTCCREASGIIHQPFPSVHPSFDMALHFPPSHSPPPSMYLGVPREKITTGRLVFDKEKVEMIRKLEASRSEVKDPTRVEAVSSPMAELRRRAYKGRDGDGDGDDFVPRCSCDEDEGEDVVSRLRATIRGVGDDFMKGVMNDDIYSANAG